MPRYNLDQLAQRIRARDEKHKTGQAKDRDSMSIMIAGFSEAARSMDVNEAVAGKSEQEKNRVARNMLNSKNRINMENARASVPASPKGRSMG